MNILLTGAAGQLGTEFAPLLSGRGKLVMTDRNPPAGAASNWLALDAADGHGVERALDQIRPALIVNAAAYTAVDQAEQDSGLAHTVNAEFPGRLARWARANDAIVMHYSTDYVFDGEGSRPYRESDNTNPQSVYGESKLAGEAQITASGCRHVIVRTAWVYSSHGKNFVLSMLNLARRGIQLGVVNDQKGCPTWAGSLARASDRMIDQLRDADKDGLYHYCDDQAMSWYEFAGKIFACGVASGLLASHPDLRPVTSAEYPQPAKRPKWSVLDTARLRENFNIRPASFEQSLKTVIDEVKAGEIK